MGIIMTNHDCKGVFTTELYDSELKVRKALKKRGESKT